MSNPIDRPGALLDPGQLMLILRVALGAVFVMGGVKLAFPSDAQALAASYVDPATGWISPFFHQQITDRLGISVASFLRIQGWVEIVLGCVLILGVKARLFAVIAGLLFWSFAVANPVAGEIRLSRDLALGGLCIAVALAGPGRWALSQWGQASAPWIEERWEITMMLVRFSLTFTLLASGLFSDGIMGNHLNSSVPPALTLVAGALLALGARPRWVAAAVVVWLVILIPATLIGSGLLAGLDSTKREIGLLAGALVYTLGGPDRGGVFSGPRRGRTQ